MITEQDIEKIKKKITTALREMGSGSVQDICRNIREQERGHVKLALYCLNQEGKVFLKENKLKYREDGGAIIESHYSLF